MATRNLTEPFILMRNNALQSKHIYAEQVFVYNLCLRLLHLIVSSIITNILFQNLSDRTALVSSDSMPADNVELRNINLSDSTPPVWADALEETQYILSRLRIKIDSLMELHAKQLTRPTLDDTSQVSNFCRL